jgi:hypothetical protein
VNGIFRGSDRFYKLAAGQRKLEMAMKKGVTSWPGYGDRAHVIVVIRQKTSGISNENIELVEM